MEISFSYSITMGNANQLPNGTPITINVNTNMNAKSVSSSSQNYDEEESYRKLMRRYVRANSF